MAYPSYHAAAGPTGWYQALKDYIDTGDAGVSNFLVEHNSDGTHDFPGTPTGAKFLRDDRTWALPPTAAFPALLAAEDPYNVSADATAAANAAGIQAALDDADGRAVILPPRNAAGNIQFNTTLLLGEQAILIGYNVMGLLAEQACVLEYTGANATNAIQMATPDLNGPWLEGFRLTDGRSAPTTGDMIHLEECKNGLILRNLRASTSSTTSGSGIYLGARDTSHTIEMPTVENVWVGGKTAGIYLEDLEDWFHISRVACDIAGSTAAAIIIGPSVSGQANGLIESVKMESNTGAHGVRILTGANAAVTINGVTLLSGNDTQSAGDCVRLEDAGSIVRFGMLTGAYTSAGTSATNLLNDTVNSRTWPSTSANRMMSGGWINGRTTNGRNLELSAVEKQVTAVSSSTTLDDTHHIVLVTTAGSSRTMTLPAAASSRGLNYIIKKVDSGVGTVVIDANASETIDGATTLTLTSQYDKTEIVCNGTAWFVV